MSDAAVDSEAVTEEAKPGPGLIYGRHPHDNAAIVDVYELLKEIEKIVRLQDPWAALSRLNALKLELKENL